jgi:xylan 1,4-beta-xylosidase
MVWNYHDDNILLPATPVHITISGIPGREVLVRHFRIDRDHSNSYERWKAMGSPQQPTPGQYSELEQAGQLQMMCSPQWMKVDVGEIRLTIDLPGQAVSLLEIEW